jgi:hypothetical protein
VCWLAMRWRAGKCTALLKMIPDGLCYCTSTADLNNNYYILSHKR